MRESVFRKVLSLFLCGVLLAGAMPGHIHAEELETEPTVLEEETQPTQPAGLTPDERYAVVNRSMDSWYFPLAEEFFGSIKDFAG